MGFKVFCKYLSKIIITLIFITAVIVNYGERAYAAAANLDETAVEYYELKNKLEQMLKNEQGTYGVFVMDLKSGKALGINPLEPFHAASTFKLPLNIYLYKKIAQGEVDPKNMLVYESRHYEGGTGQLQYKTVGSSFDIEMLSKYSIVYSDNVATNMLLTYLGRQNVKNYMRTMGGLVVDDNKNITCPRDMALYMQKLLDFNTEQPDPTSKLIGYLENTIYNDRIPKLLPDNVRVAHKIGNWPPTGTYNDVGYVQHPGNPYIIAVFSKDTPGVNRAFGVIQQVSKAVYDYQSSNNFADINLVFNGNTLESDIPSVLENGRVIAPVRAVAEALGAEVQWDSETNSVAVLKSGKKIVLQINSPNVSVNNVMECLDVPAKIIKNRTMVPVRFISETLGAQVSWENATHTVKITPAAGNDTQVTPVTPVTPVDDVQVIKEEPENFEGNSSVATVLTWEDGDRTIYYFSWGMKNTGGYTLSYLELEGSTIKVKAAEPAPGSIVTQAITYPRLILSLPKGEYTYQVVNEQGEEIEF